MTLAICVAYSWLIVSRSEVDPPSSVFGVKWVIGRRESSWLLEGIYCSAKLGLGESRDTWIWRLQHGKIVAELLKAIPIERAVHFV